MSFHWYFQVILLHHPQKEKWAIQEIAHFFRGHILFGKLKVIPVSTKY